MVTFWNSHAASLTVALAVGLLIGLDREKQKDANSLPDAAAVRTFTLVALLGAIAALAESNVIVAVLGVGVVILDVLFSYTNRLRRPRETTTFALLATFAIGFMTVQHVEKAAALGVLIALLWTICRGPAIGASGCRASRRLAGGRRLQPRPGARACIWRHHPVAA